jgi:predicted MPP superfamily phosphohydrolase
MKYAWASDIHLDHLTSDDDVIAFCNNVNNFNADGIFITGDISNGKHLLYHLSLLEEHLKVPKYFVLGNHDFWYTGIDKKRNDVKLLCEKSEFLKYMTTSTYVSLTKQTAVIGHDGWYDGQHGAGIRSSFIMNDWVLTGDFIEASGGDKYVSMMHKVKDIGMITQVCQRLAKQSVDHVSKQIKDAVKYHKNVVVLTHVPAFKESHMYRGKVGDDEAQPWYTSKIMGDTLLAAASTYKDCKFTVLSGHTHGFFRKNILPNLEVIVSSAMYGSPAFHAIDIE